MKFTKNLKRIFYSIVVLMFLSGTFWWYFENFVKVHTPLGEDHHFMQAYFLRIHGTVAYFFLILFGFLIDSHLRPGLNQNRSRYSGFTMLAWIGALVLTAIYQLYGTEGGVRDFLTGAHRWIGLMLPLILAFHLYCGKRRRRQKP